MKTTDEIPDRNTNGDQREDVNKDDENLPGYPHYPASEDVMNIGMERIDADVEALPRANSISPEVLNALPKTPSDQILDPVLTDEERATPNDLNADDLVALGSDEIANDLGEDEELRDRVNPVDMAASDLDVPGSELDDSSEEIGTEDEENNFYSLGGDNHDN